MSWLLSSIIELMLGHVVHYKTSDEIWKVFDQLFTTRSKVRILLLRFSLQTTRKGVESVEEYILKMTAITYDLMATRHNVLDDELILYILGGLGSDFESVVVNLTSRYFITIYEVQFLLQTHKICVEQLAITSFTSFHILKRS